MANICMHWSQWIFTLTSLFPCMLHFLLSWNDVWYCDYKILMMTKMIHHTGHKSVPLHGRFSGEEVSSWKVCHWISHMMDKNPFLINWIIIWDWCRCCILSYVPDVKYQTEKWNNTELRCFSHNYQILCKHDLCVSVCKCVCVSRRD